MSAFVALRKESVDRNWSFVVLKGRAKLSLSARRAWIEIYLPVFFYKKRIVALRKESVDRNRISRHLVGFHTVALRKESVDRNITRG